MTVGDFYVLLQEHLARNPFPDMPLRIRVDDVDYDISQIVASDSHLVLEVETATQSAGTREERGHE